MAARLYLQDYDDTFPWNPAPGGLPASHWGPAFRVADCAAQPTTSFVVLLQPYMKYKHVFACPAYSGYEHSRHLGYAGSLEKAGYEGGSEATWGQKIGYGFNEVLVAHPCRPRALDSLKNGPQEVALFADAEQPWASSTDRWVQVKGEWERFWDWDPHGRLRHGEGQNFIFADGRVRWRRPVVENEKGEEARGGYFPDAKLE
jgi:hypothetical protein